MPMIPLVDPALTREGQLLVLCARTVLSPSVLTRIGRLASGRVDWKIVVESAKWHGVVPLLYRALLHGCRETVPAGVLTELRQYYHASAMLSHSLAKELVVLCRHLTSQGVSVLPFKGLTLAASAYGDVAARECGDVDLIIEREAVARARKVLLAAGYEDGMAMVGRSDDPDGPFQIYVRKDRSVTVDLQWVMADGPFSFRLDQDRFWRRSRMVNLPGSVVPGLSPEDLLIILCVHGSKHAWERLKWVCDVAELVRAHPGLNWSYVWDAALEMRCRRLLLMGLALAQRLFNVTLPDSCHQRVAADADVPQLARRMPQSLLADPARGINEAQADAFHYTLQDSWRDRLKFGLLLCRGGSPALDTRYPWFRSHGALRRLDVTLRPLRRLAAQAAPLDSLKRAVSRWLLPAN